MLLLALAGLGLGWSTKGSLGSYLLNCGPSNRLAFPQYRTRITTCYPNEIEWIQALISYQYYHMLLLAPAGLWNVLSTGTLAVKQEPQLKEELITYNKPPLERHPVISRTFLPGRAPNKNESTKEGMLCIPDPHGETGPDFVPGLPHVILLEMRQALISYQDGHT